MIVLEMLSHYKVTTDTVDRARVTPAVGMALADEILGERSGATDAPNAVTHTCQLPANLPCEDVFYAAVFEIAVTCTRAGAPGLYLTDMQDHGQRKCSVAYCHCSWLRA